MKLSIITKLALLIVALTIITAFAVSEVYLKGSNHILVDDAILDLEKETEFFKYPLNGTIAQLQDDARFLSRISDGAKQETLVPTLSELLLSRGYYKAIDYSGAGGSFGIIRAGNQTSIIKDKLSGDVNALHLAPGEVYLSEPELEKKNGKVQVPYILVLRAAAPIYERGAEKATGVIIITLDFGKVLADIKQQLLPHRTLYISNNNGDYLLNPDPAKLYASDLGHAERIQKDYPKVIEPMADPNLDTAAFLSDETANGKALAFLEDHYDAAHPDRYVAISVEAPYRDIISKTLEVERRGFLFSAAIAVIAVISAIFMLRILIRPLNRVADAVVRYRKGEKAISLPEGSPDEIGVLAKEFKAMMAQKDEEDWVKENLVGIAKNILGFKDLKNFASALMEYVTLAVGAEVGVFYISGVYGRHIAEKETEILSFLGGSGYKEHEKLPQSFKLGEGLIGQCALDGKARLISDIPEDYLRIASALGNAKPKHLFLLPLFFENTLVGVIELASVSRFSEVHRAFLERLAFNIGVIVNSISAGMRTEELLEEARMTAEELQRSEEELKTQQEELQASNEEMEEKTRALEEQNAQIRRQSLELQENKLLIEQKANELEISSKYKSEFLANMSHELRTPLNSLLILARTLAGNEEGNLTEEQVEEAMIIHNGGLELLGLINDILDLSKVEAGKISIVPEQVSISAVMKKIAEQFEPIAKETDAEFRFHIEEGLPQTFYTDQQRVEQILKNLLSNAFKFTEKGSVTLEVQRFSGNGAQRQSLAQGALSFSVADTGIGIEESKLKDIFEAFQQEDGSTGRHYGGTGLGLTIARKFAHLLGGEIHVASKKGEGSKFTLILPLKMPEAPVVKYTVPAPPAVQKIVTRAQLNAMPQASLLEFIPDDRKTISAADKILLVIEDDEKFAETLALIARRRGYKFLAAGDGRTGLMLAASFPVTAIILDLGLPDIAGMQVLGQLKHDLNTRHIPVHIITASEQKGASGSLRKGAVGYLTKPARKEDIDGVFARIEELLQSNMKKLLVVEDDKKTQTAIEKLLRKKDIEITFVSKGGTALEILANERFDCIILDLRLPDMSGFEWLEEAEARAGGQEIPPIIIYTARELTEEENRKLSRHTGSIIIKGATSSERLLDEVTLFLHSVESSLSDEQREMIRMQHDPDKMLEGRAVLLVDDDLRNSFALSKLLKKHGMKVLVADNGQMALEKLAEEKATELVIMDIMMPIMDGYQAIKKIRSRPAFQDIPIIALTARAMPEEQEKCIAAGANDYLVKPVDIERLLTLMRVWLFKQEKL